MGGRGRGLESVRSEKFAINSEGQVIAYIMLCNVEPIDIDIYIRDLGKVLSVRPKPVRHYLFSVEKCRIVLSVIFRSYVRT